MEEQFTELALNVAALETDCPLLARAFYLYRISNSLSVETLARWLGLNAVSELNRLAQCLTPRHNSYSSWDESFNELVSQFPTLRRSRLQLIVAATSPTREVLV